MFLKRAETTLPDLARYLDPDYVNHPFVDPVCDAAEYRWIHFLTARIVENSPIEVKVVDLKSGHKVTRCEVIQKFMEGTRSRLVISSDQNLVDGVLLNTDPFLPANYVPPVRGLRTFYDSMLTCYSDFQQSQIERKLSSVGIRSNSQIGIGSIMLELLKLSGLNPGSNFLNNTVSYSRYLKTRVNK